MCNKKDVGCWLWGLGKIFVYGENKTMVGAVFERREKGARHNDRRFEKCVIFVVFERKKPTKNEVSLYTIF